MVRTNSCRAKIYQINKKIVNLVEETAEAFSGGYTGKMG